LQAVLTTNQKAPTASVSYCANPWRSSQVISNQFEAAEAWTFHSRSFMFIRDLFFIRVHLPVCDKMFKISDLTV